MAAGSRLNIIRFGSTVDPMFPESQPYNDQTLEHAKGFITEMGADLGSTDLRPALAVALSAKCCELPRIVFVLTDGEVSQTSEVLALARDNAGHLTRTRIFSLGIGKGASVPLVSGLARAGSGSAAFVDSPEELKPVVVHFMAQSMLSCSEAPRISLEDHHARMIAINSHPRRAVFFRNETAVVTSLVKFDTPQQDTPMVCHFQGSTAPIAVPIKEFPMSRSSITRLAVKATITDLLAEPDSRAEVLRLSLEFNVLCPLTSFAVVSERTGEACTESLVSEAFPLSKQAAEIAKTAPIHVPCTGASKPLSARPSLVTPPSVGRGQVVMIGGVPCTVREATIPKTGKHGLAKAHIVAVDPFTGKKMETLVMASQLGDGSLSSNNVIRSEYTVIDIDPSDSRCQVLDDQF
jgi:translation elongation factor P/translation initiation factor 5A